MKTSIISYDLLCANCQTIRPNGMAMINSNELPDYSTRDALIRECDHFSNVSCNQCGSTGRWCVLKIYLSGGRRIIEQFILTIHQNGTEINYFIEGGIERFSDEKLRLVFNAITHSITEEKLRKEDKSFTPSFFKVEKAAIIAVDIFESSSVAEANVIYNKGIEIDTVWQLVSFLEEQIFGDDEDEDEW